MSGSRRAPIPSLCNIKSPMLLCDKPNDILLLIINTLKFTYVGYSSQEYTVNNGDKINIVLQEDKLLLTELIFTGYSTQERRDVTGSVTTVRPANLKSALSIDKMLAGQAAGVFVSGSSGALGAANLLTIRGISSIMGDNNPLYVIDGVPIYGTNRTELHLPHTEFYSCHSLGTKCLRTITNNPNLAIHSRESLHLIQDIES